MHTITSFLSSINFFYSLKVSTQAGLTVSPGLTQMSARADPIYSAPGQPRAGIADLQTSAGLTGRFLGQPPSL
jgi:hypothetical protein